MTRFQQEISGSLGEFWFRSAKKEAENARHWFETKAYVVGGIVRWKSNDRIPHDDMLEMMEYMGCEFDREKCNEVRHMENAFGFAKFLRENRSYTDEELSEMRAAFGEGTTVVNVLTGEKIWL